MIWDHEVGYMGAEGVTGLSGGSPVGLVIVEGNTFVLWTAVVAFEFGGGGL